MSSTNEVGRPRLDDPPERVVIGLPMPASLLDRIDAEVVTQRELTPHQYVSRSGTMRQLIADMLDQRETERRIRTRTRTMA